MVDFTRLKDNWLKWTGLAGMSAVKVSTDAGDSQISFESDDQSFHLRQDGSWWVLDTVDDRGRRYANIATFSDFELAEKYLIWKWASVARSTVRAAQLGARLHALGMAPGVRTSPGKNEGAVELHRLASSALVPRSFAVIFSHLMSKSVDEVEQMVMEGLD